MGSDMYRQEEGQAMGSLLYWPTYTFEEMAIGSTSLKPSIWLRYIDDTFVLCPHQEDV